MRGLVSDWLPEPRKRRDRLESAVALLIYLTIMGFIIYGAYVASMPSPMD